MEALETKITYRHGHHDGDAASAANAIDFGAEDLTRHEFADEADINVLVGRHGVPQQMGLRYGEADYTVDAHEALNAARTARAAYWRLPADVRQRYSSWAEVLEASRRGELTSTEKAEVTDGKETPKATVSETAQ